MDPTCVDCGAQLGVGPYCGDCGAWNGDGEPPPRPDRRCPICGTVNQAQNVHCEKCAFRLDRESVPPRRASFAIRLVTIGSLLLIGVIVTFLTARDAGDGAEGGSIPDGAATAPSNASSTGGSGSSGIAPARPSSVSASSSFSEALGPQNLIDGDPSTYWNDDSLGGDGAEIILEFDQPVAIERLVVQNVADEVAFSRNYRIREYEITTDDLPAPFTGNLDDTQEPQAIAVVTTGTTQLRLRVISTYPAEPVGDQPAFEELAVAEIEVLGAAVSG